MTVPSDELRIVRIIARLNIGGPAIQAISLTRRLEPYGFRTRLVRGSESPSEGNMDYLAKELGVLPTHVPAMRREPGVGDLRALWQLTRILRSDRPQIVHTHAAKAGTLGRIATLLAFPRRRTRPVLIHTYHGHSLTGYFSGRRAGVYRAIERALARFTDVLVAVSAEVRDDLVGLSVAPAQQFVVIPLGFDLTRFLDDSRRGRAREELRREWGIGPEEVVVTLIARLVPIKRVDRFLRVARAVAERASPGGGATRFVIVGDGELREQLQASPDARGLGEQLVWAGFRRDMPEVCFASDVVVLTSDNEGTPVSLIEAQAAAVPVVATDVGGVRSAVLDGETGLLAPAEDEKRLIEALTGLLQDPELRRNLGQKGRVQAQKRYALQRLVQDIEDLYIEALGKKGLPRRSFC